MADEDIQLSTVTIVQEIVPLNEQSAVTPATVISTDENGVQELELYSD